MTTPVSASLIQRYDRLDQLISDMKRNGHSIDTSRTQAATEVIIHDYSDSSYESDEVSVTSQTPLMSMSKDFSDIEHITEDEVTSTCGKKLSPTRTKTNKLRRSSRRMSKKHSSGIKKRNKKKSISLSEPRNIYLNSHTTPETSKFPLNIVRNTKFTAWNFLPKTMIEQFSIFSNQYFLATTISQFIPVLKVGFFISYWLPLLFVVAISITKEAYDDLQRRKSDIEANTEQFKVLRSPSEDEASAASPGGSSASGSGTLVPVSVPASGVQVGDYVLLETNQRVPADIVLLRSSNSEGNTFVRTDQLDGETDWKLRLALAPTQSYGDTSSKDIAENCELGSFMGVVYCPPPDKNLYRYMGRLTSQPTPGSRIPKITPISEENTIWGNSVIASGSCIGLVIYTGKETKSALNASEPALKTGTVDRELNALVKILFVFLLFLSLAMVIIPGIYSPTSATFWIEFLRFVLLFCNIIPLSMKVNVDLGKAAYSYFIGTDTNIPGVKVRSSSIPEELGRIQFLMTDKTGTLTRNEMHLKKLTLGEGLTFLAEQAAELRGRCAEYQHGLDDDEDDLEAIPSSRPISATTVGPETVMSEHSTVPGPDGSFSATELVRRRPKRFGRHARSADTGHIGSDAVTQHLDISLAALSICHNVTPVLDAGFVPEGGFSPGEPLDISPEDVVLEASSPDEIALVKFAAECGRILVHREHSKMVITSPTGIPETWEIAHIFPFSASTKRMGIIVKHADTGRILLLVKGADSVISRMLDQTKPVEWLPEQVSRLGSDGLRTLVFAYRELSASDLSTFNSRYSEARADLVARDSRMLSEQRILMRGLTLLCVSGVEDRLQDNVPLALEQFRNASIQIWMLTGDKMETAKVIARASRLVSPATEFFTMENCTDTQLIHTKLRALELDRDCNDCLVIDGATLEAALANSDWRPRKHGTMLDRLGQSLRKVFLSQQPRGPGSLGGGLAETLIRVSSCCPAVVCCRCAPDQKAQLVRLVQSYTGRSAAAVGDGGNDVSMILAAAIGIGLIGKEGQQASMAADYALLEFSSLADLMFWHGRNSYIRSANIAQFVMQRGITISFMQALFSAYFYFQSVPLFSGWLLIGYAAYYTMAPVFALVLDEDIAHKHAFLYPELYRDLVRGRALSIRTFLLWNAMAVWAAGSIMLLTFLLMNGNFFNIVAIAFSVLILIELITLGYTIHRWRWSMVFCELGSWVLYVLSILLMKAYFSQDFILSWSFWWRTCLISLVAALPIWGVIKLNKLIHPPPQLKLRSDPELRWKRVHRASTKGPVSATPLGSPDEVVIDDE